MHICDEWQTSSTDISGAIRRAAFSACLTLQSQLTRPARE